MRFHTTLDQSATLMTYAPAIAGGLRRDRRGLAGPGLAGPGVLGRVLARHSRHDPKTGGELFLARHSRLTKVRTHKLGRPSGAIVTMPRQCPPLGTATPKEPAARAIVGYACAKHQNALRSGVRPPPGPLWNHRDSP
jgi:hypothetical protein